MKALFIDCNHVITNVKEAHCRGFSQQEYSKIIFGRQTKHYGFRDYDLHLGLKLLRTREQKLC